MPPQDPNAPNPSQNPLPPMGPQPGMPPAPQQPFPPQPMQPPQGPEAPMPPLPPAPPQPTPPMPPAGPVGPAPGMPPAGPAPLPPQPMQPPVPPQGMGGAPFPPSGPSMPTASHPLAPAKQKKKMMTLVILAVAALLVVGAIIFFAMKLLGGIKLESYSNDNITVMVPVGYQKTEENGGATFEEKEGKDDTHSEVIAFYEALPAGLSEGDLEQFRGTLRTVLQQAAESSASGSGQSIKNMKITDITFNGDKALKLTGDAVEDGKTVGSYTMVAGLNSKAVYMVGVGVHKSDPGLGKKVDTIINSFKLK